MERTFQNLQARYAELSTQELLTLAATADLTPMAATALESELAKRRAEVESTTYELVERPGPKPIPHFLHLWITVGIGLLGAIGSGVAWLWEWLGTLR